MILLTGHYGNWEIAGYLFGMFGYPTYSVARTLDNPYLERFLRSFRERTGQKLIPKAGGYDQILEVLKSGQTLSMLADQDAGQRQPRQLVADALLGAAGCNAVLVPWHAPADAVRPVMAGLMRTGNLAGIVVTHPFKTLALTLALCTLAAALATAITRPRLLPESLVAAAGALLLVAAGASSAAAARHALHGLASTVCFLAVLLILNAIVLFLLIADLRTVLARLQATQLWRIGLLAVGAGSGTGLLGLGLDFFLNFST